VYLRISFNARQRLALLSSSLCGDTQNKSYLHDSYDYNFIFTCYSVHVRFGCSVTVF